MEKTVYMDYQSTTPCDPRVVAAMLPYFYDNPGNPHSSTHIFGAVAREAVEKARRQVAKIINAADEREIIFTSGATEANNLAIQGIARFYKDKGQRIITSAIEHKCVMETCRELEHEDFEVIFAPVKENGLVDINFLEKNITEDTVLVSIMSVNNEIGTCQPIDEISKLCRAKKVFFHTDAAQAVGKIPVDASKVDLMSISGHKIYGPKGIGALYVRMNPRIRLKPIFFGGGQERGFRSGTLPTPLCVGLGEACEIAMNEMEQDNEKLLKFKDYMINELTRNLKKVYLNGDREKRIPGCLNFSFEGVEGEAIMLGMRDVCVSSGSACTSESLEPSYVLKALSVREEMAHSSLRIGMGRFTTFDEVKYVCRRVVEVVNNLRSISPLWRE